APSLEVQLEQLLSFRPSGVLLDSDLGDELQQIARTFEDAGVSVVQIGHIQRAPVADSVIVDNFGGSHTAAQHLIRQGHTRIATIRWNIERDPASRQKFAGFTCAMDEAGLEVPADYVVEAP